MKKVLIFLVSSVFLGLITIKNTALFHHITSLYTDPFFEISLVKSPKFIPKLFTDDLSLYTKGEFTPLSFLAVSIFRAIFPASPEGFHLLSLTVHLLNSLLFFLILKELINQFSAFLISLTFSFFPFSIILINDPNNFSILLGSFFSFFCMLFYLYYIKKRKTSFLLFSILSFILSILTFKPAIFLPVFLTTFHHTERYGKFVFGFLTYLFTAIFFLSYKISLSFLFIVSLIFVLIFMTNTIPERRKLFSITLSIIPFLVIILFWYLISLHIGIKPVFQYPIQKIEEAHLLDPFKFSYIWKTLLRKQGLYVFFILTILIFPFLTGGERWQNTILIIFLGLFVIFSVKISSFYRNDLSYWENMYEGRREPIVGVNLAQAYIKEDRLDDAKRILFKIKYETEDVPPLLEDTVNVELGIIYKKLGKIKVSAYYFLQKPKGALPGASKIAKWRLIPIGDFLFDLGYLSYAENYYASALVLDPYDMDIYKKLGKVLVYKNFFRASIRYFEKVLSYNPYDREAIYYAMFASYVIKDKERYERYLRMWKRIEKKGPDFRKIYEKFEGFKKEVRDLISEDPIVLFYTGRTDKVYVYRLKGKIYKFWEVPFEVGKYFYEEGKYDVAIEWLSYAYELSGARQPLEYLKMAQQKRFIPTEKELLNVFRERR